LLLRTKLFIFGSFGVLNKLTVVNWIEYKLVWDSIVHKFIQTQLFGYSTHGQL